ncbi:MAG: GtrA family protein [Oscillospiraceae bacterium]|nr:GtrA family protein [Oscillospiraceae bacterium]
MSKTENGADLMHEVRTFFGARAVSFFMELGLMWLTTAHWKWNYALMAFLVQFVILAMNYIFSKLVVFKKGASAEEQKPEAGRS